MKKYTALVKHASPELPDGVHDIYLASDIDTRIAELEKRLLACEGAMLVGCDTSHRAIIGYMIRYPDPYLPTSHP